jgi:import inner membrane translocase subunit TIM17
MGAIGGGVFHLIRGSWNAPKNSRLTGALNAATARGPVLGGQFAVWGGLFACCDCSLTAIRQKEDPWNSIMSGAATGGILAARAGPKAVAQSAVVGGVLLGLIEGMGIMLNKMLTPDMPSPEEMAAMGASDPTAPPTSGGMGMSAATAPPSSAGSAPPEPSSGSSADGRNPFDILAGGDSSSGDIYTSDSGNTSDGKFDTFGTDTQFSSGTSMANEVPSEKKSGWWPFGSNGN